MKRKPMTWRDGLFLTVIFGTGSLIVLSGHNPRARLNHDRTICQTNLRLISLACAQYSLDYDALPLVSTGSEGWVDALGQYTGGYEMFGCPSANNQPDHTAINYFFNSRAAGLAWPQFTFRSQTVLFGDGPVDGGASANFSALPRDWITDRESPVNRHLDGGNFAFADFHVKWLRPKMVTLHSPESGYCTFLVR